LQPADPSTPRSPIPHLNRIRRVLLFQAIWAKPTPFRILVRKLGERSKVWSRRGADFTDRFPTIAEVVRRLSMRTGRWQARRDGLNQIHNRFAHKHPIVFARSAIWLG
jgi:hypothetical protein